MNDSNAFVLMLTTVMDEGSKFISSLLDCHAMEVERGANGVRLFA